MQDFVVERGGILVFPELSLDRGLFVSRRPLQLAIFLYYFVQQHQGAIQRLRRHALAGRFRGEKQGALREWTARIFLCQDLEMGLGVREILPAIISLSQFHPDIGHERRAWIFSEKIVGGGNHFRRIGVRDCVF